MKSNETSPEILLARSVRKNTPPFKTLTKCSGSSGKSFRICFASAWMRLWIRGPEIRILTLSPGVFLFLRCFFPRLSICFLICEFRTVAQAPLRGKTPRYNLFFGRSHIHNLEWIQSRQCDARSRHWGKSRFLFRTRRSFPQDWL